MYIGGIMNCKHCGTLMYKKQVFCNSSCSASYNNKGIRRHGKEIGNCSVCNNKKSSNERKYCSRKCFGIASTKSKEHNLARNAEAQSKYRSKKYRVYAPGADKEKIKEFYRNRPEGYEVDHIIPLCRGGLHHQDNLQYLLKENNRRKGKRMVGDPGYDPSHHTVMSSRPSHLAHPPN